MKLTRRVPQKPCLCYEYEAKSEYLRIDSYVYSYLSYAYASSTLRPGTISRHQGNGLPPVIPPILITTDRGYEYVVQLSEHGENSPGPDKVAGHECRHGR